MGGTNNKNLNNILRQNLEVISSLRKNWLAVNYINFFINKIFSY